MGRQRGRDRSPVFAFADLREAGRFVVWVVGDIGFKREAAATTRHGQLIDLRITIEGNNVFLLLDYVTGDAAGQNMVTIATEAVPVRQRHRPVKPRRWYVEGNMSGDKKASSQSFQTVRCKKVIAEVAAGRPRAAGPAGRASRWSTTASRRPAAWLSGNIGIQGHYADGLAAV